MAIDRSVQYMTMDNLDALVQPAQKSTAKPAQQESVVKPSDGDNSHKTENADTQSKTAATSRQKRSKASVQRTRVRTSVRKNKSGMSTVKIPIPIVNAVQDIAFEIMREHKVDVSTNKSDVVSAYLVAALGRDVQDPTLTPEVRTLAMQMQKRMMDSDTITTLRQQNHEIARLLSKNVTRLSGIELLIATMLASYLGIHDPTVWQSQIRAPEDIRFDDNTMRRIVEQALSENRRYDHDQQMRNNPDRKRG